MIYSLCEGYLLVKREGKQSSTSDRVRMDGGSYSETPFLLDSCSGVSNAGPCLFDPENFNVLLLEKPEEAVHLSPLGRIIPNWLQPLA